MELVDGNRKLEITIGNSGTGANGSGVATAVWDNWFCSCKVYEAIKPAQTGEDREF
jgi:hypothetical protein